jgi:hypothetical protein
MPENRPRTELPRGIPGPLRDFVRCRVDSAELEPGDLDWVPKPEGPMVPENLPDPSVSFAEGEGGGVDITLAWGFLSVTLSATVSGGKLSISAPSPLIPTGDIDAWVEDLNADLEANGKQLEGLSLVDGKLRATKQAIPAPVEEAAAVAAAPTAVAVTPPEEEPILGDGAPLGVRRF